MISPKLAESASRLESARIQVSCTGARCDQSNQSFWSRVSAELDTLKHGHLRQNSEVTSGGKNALRYCQRSTERRRSGAHFRTC